ncbi:hypothetical protein M422DRAFT_171213, partial [Sphaerobolus stellatus SS14]
LRQQCPACFGRRHWGGDPETNPDVQVAIDGNFTHQRYSSVEGDPEIVPLSQLTIWLTEGELEVARQHIQDAHDRTGKRRQSTRLPDGSLDQCEKAHKAARDRGDEVTTGVMASKGLMALVCKHDVPIFICDITTPGEQQFYSIALLQKLSLLLPANAIIGLLYDIACLLDRSIAKAGLPYRHDLIPDISLCLSLATAAFHAYAHQFCCQIVFHPRKCVGFGMTNGEGNEHIWALSKDTIGSERISGVGFPPVLRLALLLTPDSAQQMIIFINSQI